jgi:hypothetical protein
LRAALEKNMAMENLSTFGFSTATRPQNSMTPWVRESTARRLGLCEAITGDLKMESKHRWFGGLIESTQPNESRST